MEKSRFKGVRGVALVIVGIFFGATLLTPAVAHVTRSVTHLFAHTDKRYYKKTVSDTRYVRKGSPAGGDLAGTYPNPSIEDGAVTSAKLAPAEGVQSPTLLSCEGATNWSGTLVAFAKNVGFWKDQMGIVHLQGGVGCTGNAAEGSVIFQLPSGYRPGGSGVLRWAALSGGVTVSQIAILENGQIVYDGPNSTAADDYISLDGFTFRPGA